jgi:hypothetical protein
VDGGSGGGGGGGGEEEGGGGAGGGREEGGGGGGEGGLLGPGAGAWFELRSDAGYGAGEEVLISYGEKGNR